MKIVVLIGVLLAAPAFAGVECVNNKQSRLVEIQDVDAGCVVKANSKIIYKAKRDKDYCKKKAAIHTDKLTKLGWKCVG